MCSLNQTCQFGSCFIGNNTGGGAGTGGGSSTGGGGGSVTGGGGGSVTGGGGGSVTGGGGGSVTGGGGGSVTGGGGGSVTGGGGGSVTGGGGGSVTGGGGGSVTGGGGGSTALTGQLWLRGTLDGGTSAQTISRQSPIGTPPQQVSPGTRRMNGISVSDDGTMAVGSADATTDELMVLSLSGGTPISLRTSPSSVSILGPVLSPNKQWVAYTEGNTSALGFDLFVVAAMASSTPRRATPLRNTAVAPNLLNVGTYAFSPDSRYLAAMGDYTNDGVFELSVFDTVSGTITQPITIPAAGVGQNSREFGWTNTGSIVVRAALNGSTTRLHVCTVSGSCTPLAGTTTTATVTNLAVSKDGTFAVYASNERSSTAYDLYRVSTAGGAPTRLLPDVPTGWRPTTDSMLVSPDGAFVTSIIGASSSQDLYVFSTSGGSPLTPMWTSPVMVAILSPTWAANSAHLAFRADLVTDGSYDVWRLPDLRTPGQPVLMQSSQGGDVIELRWTN
jgi:hypothetical protein